MATATDDFNRANETPLSGGGNWQDGPGAYGSVNLNTNKIRAATTGADVASRYGGTTFGNDQYSQAKMATLSGSGSRYIGVNVRIRLSTDGDSYSALYVQGSGVVELYDQSDTGSIGSTLIASITSTFAVNDILKLEVIGTTSNLKVYKNGSQIGTTQSDSTWTTGQPGVAFYTVDVAQIELDDWEGGDVGGTPTVFPERLLLLGAGP